MPETIIFHALDLSGETTLKLFLRKDDGSLLNTGGDALAEISSSGVFEATLAESRTGLGTLSVRVCDGTETADNLLYDDFLPESSTVIGAMGVAVLDAATLTQLDDIETAVDANTGYLTAITSALSTLAAKVRKYFQLSLRKDAAIATDNATELGEINANGGTGAGAFANTTESNEAIRDRGDAAWTTGSGGGSGSLTQEDLNAIIAGVQAVHLNITEAVENCGLTITKGDTWIQDIDGLGDLSTKRITFALKADRRDADSAAIVFIDEADGLTYLNGAVAGTPGDGAIEILDESAGDIRIRLESAATKLIPTGKYVDAVKAIKDNADFTLRNNGTTTVVYGVIQKIS